MNSPQKEAAIEKIMDRFANKHWSEQIENSVRQGYNKGYNDGYEQCKIDTIEGIKAIPKEELDKCNPYISGMNDAWEIAKKLIHNKPAMYGKELYDIFDKMTPQEAKALFILLEEPQPRPKTNMDKFVEVFNTNDFIGAPWMDNKDVLGKERDWWNEPFEEPAKEVDV